MIPTAEDLRSAVLVKADVRKARIAATTARLELPNSSTQRRSSARGRPYLTVSVPTGTPRVKAISAVDGATVPAAAHQQQRMSHFIDKVS